VDYVVEQLLKLLGGTHSGLRAPAVTGAVGDEQRREIVDGVAEEKVRVLVTTDCRSEGINLQKDFEPSSTSSTSISPSPSSRT